MQWRGRRTSRNVEDRRGKRSVGKTGGVGGLGLVAVLVIGYFLGIDVSPLLQGGGGQQSQTVSQEITPQDRAAGEFVSVVLADTEEVWDEIFRQQVGEAYDPATLVLFKGATQSPCGGANGASGLELQADCFSGIWARYAEARFNSLERGDLAEAVNAAKQIGDDTLQRNAGRRPNPHTFTHGTSEQRQRWFARGYENPNIQSCDTFSAQQL